jgi:hypothetical protein
MCVCGIQDMARELSTGAFIVVELSGSDAVNSFREVCGPRDVDVAKRIRSALRLRRVHVKVALHWCVLVLLCFADRTPFARCTDWTSYGTLCTARTWRVTAPGKPILFLFTATIAMIFCECSYPRTWAREEVETARKHQIADSCFIRVAFSV